jgi:hypothetical protein
MTDGLVCLVGLAPAAWCRAGPGVDPSSGMSCSFSFPSGARRDGRRAQRSMTREDAEAKSLWVAPPYWPRLSHDDDH